MSDTEYRKRLIQRTTAAAKEFEAACLAVKDPYAPIEEGGWNVHQLAAHTRDVDKLVYGLRFRRTLEEDNPAFANFDGDAYMAAHYDPSESLSELLDGLVRNVGIRAERLSHAADEAWRRPSSHEIDGAGLTVEIWVERGLKHIEEHLATVRKAS